MPPPDEEIKKSETTNLKNNLRHPQGLRLFTVGKGDCDNGRNETLCELGRGLRGTVALWEESHLPACGGCTMGCLPAR